jgi:hypothetical protein
MRKSFTRHLLAGAAFTAVLMGAAGAGAHGRDFGGHDWWQFLSHKRPYWHGLGNHHHGTHGRNDMMFNRVATFPVFLNSDIDNHTVAEIVAATDDGRTLVYTDSPLEAVGFVDIANPHDPRPLGKLDLPGEPTSVAVWHQYALVAVNTSQDYVNTSGVLVVVDIARQTIVREIALGGQPDSIAISGDHRYAAIAIENERDEELGSGAPPQMPAGYVMIVDTVGAVADWSARKVDLVGVPDLFPEDPEPEFISINEKNVAVLTLQENNHIALIDLASGSVVDDFPAGTVDLTGIDTDDNGLISFTGSLDNIAREPDGAVWIDRDHFVSADEGDLYGGSRGFTIFNADGDVAYASGNALDHTAARVGHYPEGRSDNKGVEPENAAQGWYGRDHYLFVNSERASLIYVYKLDRWSNEPTFVQALPAGGIGPEGGLAIPERGLYITASEEDSRDDLYRGAITIFQLQRGDAEYPKILSADRVDGTPIPWAGLSGLALDPDDEDVAYTIHDNVYDDARIYVMDRSSQPAVIVDEIELSQSDDLDLEGVTVASDGTFWVASEGNAAAIANRLVQVAPDGTVLQTVQLPDATEARKTGNGFEGLAAVTERVHGGDRDIIYVAFQREWAGDPERLVRIGRYDTVSGEWTFAYYPIEAPSSPLGGWVGLSEIASVGNGRFAVIERDNQAGADARIKLITEIDVSDTEFLDESHAGAFNVLPKVVKRDLVARGDLLKANGVILEKLESLAVTRNGTAIVINDNDGVDDSTGETQVYTVDRLFQQPRPRPPVFAWLFAWLGDWR